MKKLIIVFLAVGFLGCATEGTQSASDEPNSLDCKDKAQIEAAGNNMKYRQVFNDCMAGK